VIADHTSAYAAAGVDIDEAERAKRQYAPLAAMTRRPEVLADIGPFAGLFQLGAYRDPVLVASADGVGTKVRLARLAGRFDTIGRDLVNHCVNDALTSGARPLFFLDYLAGDSVDAATKVEVVRGVAEACRDAGMALLGGETADMPGVYLPRELDLAGFIVGVVERDEVIDGSRIEAGDVAIVLPSNGLHTNGYSLARRVFDIGMGGDPGAERARALEAPAALGEPILEALLRPHHCYLAEVEQVRSVVKGIAHITGGGLPGNVNRILPPGLGVRLDARAWSVPPIFRLIQQRGEIPPEEMFRAFNMGAGIVLVVAPNDERTVLERLPHTRSAGRVEAVADQGQVIIEGMDEACARS
jgi:phosphoribosylformylglycinamidine cyclo-ligase